MGLDMYLNAKKYISKIDWEATNKLEDLGDGYAVHEQFNDIIRTAEMEDFPLTDIHGLSVEVGVAYWRKVNAVHAWFVQNVQSGEDNCRDYYVSTDNLKELLGICQLVLGNRDPSLLPPSEGFFFGGTEIDEWYWKGIESTIEQINAILSMPDFENYSLYYQSSW